MKPYRLAFLGLALFSLASCSKDLVYFPNSTQDELHQAVERGIDGIITYVNKTDGSLFYASGFSDRVLKVEAQPQDLFKIASISKLYIAAATAKLVAADSLALHMTLDELIPEVKGRIANASKITLAMLLRHRSGIPDYIFESGFKSDTKDSYLEVASLIFDKAAEFEPGKDYAYSNTNYLLIGEILDRSLGYSHHEYIQKEILDFLDLKNTYHLYHQADTNQVMHGYLLGWEPDLKSQDHVLPGGSMVASAEDVGLFIRAMIDGSLFTNKEQAIYGSIYEYGHTGWIPGYTSIARYHPEIDAVIVQFVNTSGKEIFWLELERTYNRIVQSVEHELQYY